MPIDFQGDLDAALELDDLEEVTGTIGGVAFTGREISRTQVEHAGAAGSQGVELMLVLSASDFAGTPAATKGATITGDSTNTWHVGEVDPIGPGPVGWNVTLRTWE